MSEVKVEHRRAAAKALGWWGPALLGEHAAYWLQHGGNIVTIRGKALNMTEENTVAVAIAEAEARGYAKCQADVVAKAERDAAIYRSIERSERAQGAGNALTAFAKALARGEHIGASDSKEGS